MTRTKTRLPCSRLTSWLTVTVQPTIPTSSQTIENFGLAKMIRITNNYDVKIKDIDINVKVVVKSNLAKTHKFIYIEKDKYVKDGIGNDSI
jgi:hypothetical protein